MKQFFGAAAHPQKEALLQYMKNGYVSMVTASRVVDAVTGERVNIELVFMNDGDYSWNSSVIYHFEKYNLSLPAHLIEHVLSVAVY